MKISGTILVKNGARRLDEVIKALSCCDEIVLYDTGSTDDTLLIAQQYPHLSIYRKPFNGFGPCHNEAARLAKHDWILSIDADEVLSSALAQEIAHIHLDPQTVYSLPFQNYYNGKVIKWCGWYPERHIRLYNRKSTAFSEALVHEGVISSHLRVVALQQPLLHYPYESLSDFLIKMERYSTLFAEQHYKKKRVSPWTAVIHGAAAFFKSFFLKKGFLGGYEGFLISAYNGHTAFYKYLKLFQANRL
jgi:glycosyltransferase involved in cell wall biosynthesis